MNLRKRSAIVILFFFTGVNLLIFQNCGPQFASSKAVNPDTTAQLSAPNISFEAPKSPLTATTTTLQFSIEFNAAAQMASVTCLLDAATSAAPVGSLLTQDCSSGKFDISNFSDGNYALTIRALSLAGAKAEVAASSRQVTEAI